MKIFILEDSDERIVMFKKYLPMCFPDVEIFIAENAIEARSIFQTEKHFDIAFLDHDLDGRAFVNSNEKNTGYQVAKTMIELGIKSTQVIVHSMNPPGAERIVSLFLDKCKVAHIPFPVLLDHLKG